jgi:lipoate-protein ligase B
MSPTLLVRWLGRVPYAEAQGLQESLVESRRRGECPDTLLLLEHPPVVTLGRRSDPRHVLLDEGELSRRGIELHETGRGGDVTFHGPGQLVGYPVVQLPPERRDAHRYLRDLEEMLIRTAHSYGLTAARQPGLTGVWVGGANRDVTSLARLLGNAPPLDEVAARVARFLAAVLGLRPALPDEPAERLSWERWDVPEGDTS